MRFLRVLTVSVLLLSFLVALVAYDRLPTNIAIHWDMDGNANIYTPKTPLSVFFITGLTAILVALLYVLPSIESLKQKTAGFMDHHDLFVLIFTMFMVMMQYHSMLWNLGNRIKPYYTILPCLALFLYYTGYMLNYIKRNYFIGIKTPWTVSSDVVWDKTHRVGSKLFKLCGLIALSGVVFPKYIMYLITLPLFVSVIYLIYYSYKESNKQ